MKPKGSQFYQYPMFIQAGQLADPNQTEYGDHFPGESVDSLKKVKLEQSEDPGTSSHRVGWEQYSDPDAPSLRASIQAEGVKEPVEMFSPNSRYGNERQYVTNGHHRLFTAADIDPKMEVPVEWLR